MMFLRCRCSFYAGVICKLHYCGCFFGLLPGQEKVGMAALRQLSLERSACKVGGWLASGTVTGKLSPTLI